MRSRTPAMGRACTRRRPPAGRRWRPLVPADGIGQLRGVGAVITVGAADVTASRRETGGSGSRPASIWQWGSSVPLCRGVVQGVGSSRQRRRRDGVTPRGQSKRRPRDGVRVSDSRRGPGAPLASAALPPVCEWIAVSDVHLHRVAAAGDVDSARLTQRVFAASFTHSPPVVIRIMHRG